MRTNITPVLMLGALLIAPVEGGAQTPFTKITASPVVSDLGVYAGCAWGDFHKTGFLDLFVAGFAGSANDFYHNNGNGTFTRIIEGNPVQEADYHIAAAVGDYDNDGNLDLAVSAGVGAPTARPNRLYHNNGNGTFSLVAGGDVANQLGFFGPCAWADYDHDGFLDLFVADHGTASDTGGNNLLFHSNGDGTFAKITTGPEVNDISVGYDAMWMDYDNDGFDDLLVINIWANAVNFLYHNNGNGTFTRVLTNALATDVWSSGATGATWGDYDNDGFLDVFVTGNDGTPDTLYHNNGDGTFTPITSNPMSLRPAGTSSVSCSWGDYDNDGYLDLFVVSGGGQNRLFHNNHDGTFTEFPFGDPSDSGSGSACSWVDYDNNGFLDLFLTRDTGSPISNLLYHNDGNTNSWLEFKLVGKASNRSAIGAKVRVHATIGGTSFWQMREINHGGGLCAQPLVAHFGLGDATNADTVRIEWPSGIVQTLTNVPARQILTLVEHQSGVSNAPAFTGVSHAINGSVTLSVTGATGFLYLFEGSTNLVNWTWLGVRSNAVGTVQFTDLHATNYPGRFYRVSIP